MSRSEYRRRMVECRAGNLNENDTPPGLAERENWLALAVELVVYILVILLPFVLFSLIPASCNLRNVVE